MYVISTHITIVSKIKLKPARKRAPRDNRGWSWKRPLVPWVRRSWMMSLLLQFLAATFFAAVFLAAGFLAADFLAAGFFATGFLAAGFLATGFLADGFLVADFLAAGFLAGDLGLKIACAFSLCLLKSKFLWVLILTYLILDVVGVWNLCLQVSSPVQGSCC